LEQARQSTATVASGWAGEVLGDGFLDEVRDGATLARGGHLKAAKNLFLHLSSDFDLAGVGGGDG
jgi:hypothetical protein